MRKVLTRIVMILSLLCLLAGIGFCAAEYFRENYLLWNGGIYRRDAASLNLRGQLPEDLETLREFPELRSLDARGTGLTLEQYEWLRMEFPRCDIRWEVPFQGEYYSVDTRKIILDNLRSEDIQLLAHLPNLTSIEAWNCDDYALLSQLQRQRPECKVFYSVHIGGQELDCDITSLNLPDVDYDLLREYLAYLPNVDKVLLSGDLPEISQLEELQRQYPEVELRWLVDVYGTVMDMAVEELDLRRSAVPSVGDLEQLLAYFPALSKVDLTGCGLPQAELVSLVQRYPDIYFRFNLTVGSREVNTDARIIDLSNDPFENVAEVESLLPCFPNLEKVVMCECGIPSEEMDALNRRHADIRFVWSVRLAGMLFRTDAVYFTPNKYGIECTDKNIYDLRYCVDMVCVDVGHMQKVTSCEWAAFMPNLKYLILADSRVRDISPLEGLTNLVFLELFQTHVQDYSVLPTCTALEDLNLSYTYGDAAPVLEMTWLKRLWWCNAPWKAISQAGECLPDTEFVHDCVSSTGGTWREGQHYYDMRDFIGMGYMTG